MNTAKITGIDNDSGSGIVISNKTGAIYLTPFKVTKTGGSVELDENKASPHIGIDGECSGYKTCPTRPMDFLVVIDEKGVAEQIDF